MAGQGGRDRREKGGMWEFSKGGKHKNYWELFNNIAVENGLKGGSLEEAKNKRAGSLDHPFYQLLLTVHENMSVP